jgi:uncharacterized protein (TIGR00730 family)
VQRICVFCGSSRGAHADYGDAAEELGRVLAAEGLGVVYGGASVGLMGRLADAALAGGAEVIGVIPQGLVDREIAHRGLSDLRVVRTMHERKALMNELADAFIALPGGFGTLEELVEVLTWAQLGLHSKPCGVLDVNGYFGHLLAFADHAHDEGFLSRAHREMLKVGETPRSLLSSFASYRAPEAKFASGPPP